MPRNIERDIKVFTAMFAGERASAETCIAVQKGARDQIQRAPGFTPVVFEPTMKIKNELARRDTANHLHKVDPSTVIGTITDEASAQWVLDNCPNITNWVGPAVNEKVIEIADREKKSFVPGVTTMADIDEAIRLKAKYPGVKMPMLKIYPAIYKNLKDFEAKFRGPMEDVITKLEQERRCQIVVEAKPDSPDPDRVYVSSPTELAAFFNSGIENKTIVIHMPNNKPRTDIADIQELIVHAHENGFEVTVSAIEGKNLDDFIEYLGEVIAYTDADSVVLGHRIFDWDTIANDDPEPSRIMQQQIPKALMDAREHARWLAKMEE